MPQVTFRALLKRAAVLAGAAATIGGAGWGAAAALKSGWSTAKAVGADETRHEVRLRAVEGVAEDLNHRVGALETGAQVTGARLQRIEDSQTRSEDFARDVREDLRDLRRNDVRTAGGKH